MNDIFEFATNQVVGVLAFIVVFWVYVREKEGEKKWREDKIKELVEAKKESEERYSGIAKERRITSEGVLTMMGKVEAHLSRSDAFEEFAKRMIKESMNAEVPKRRVADKLLQDAMSNLKITED